VDLDELYTQAAGGDQHAESELFAKLTVSFRLIAHHRGWDGPDAEEIVQEALMAIARDYREITVKKSFAAWAHTVL